MQARCGARSLAVINSKLLVTVMVSLAALSGCGGPDSSLPANNVPVGTTGDGAAAPGATTGATPAQPIISVKASDPLGFAGSGAGQDHSAISSLFGNKNGDEMEGPLEAPLDTGSADAWFDKGTRYQAKGQVHLAAYCYEKACKINPNQKAFWANLGTMYQSMNRMQSARNAYYRSWELDCLDVYSMCSIGYADSRQAKDDEAYRFYVMSLSLEPSHQDSWFNLVSILHRLEKEQFIADVQHLSVAPGDPQNIHVALALVDDYLKSHPDDYDFIVDRGYLLTRLMQISAAESCFDKALKIQPEGIRALLGQAFLYDSAGNSAKAKEIFRRVLDKSSTQAIAWAAMAAISANQGKFDEALDEYGVALKINPANGYWSDQAGAVTERKKKMESQAAHMGKSG